MALVSGPHSVFYYFHTARSKKVGWLMLPGFQVINLVSSKTVEE